MTSRTTADLIARLRAGQALCKSIGLEDASIYKEAADEIERLELLLHPDIRLIDQRLNDMYDRSEKTIWWHTPQPLLNDQKPIEIVHHRLGQHILNLLKQIEDGVYL